MTGIEIVLSVVLLGTNAFWAWNTQALINKLMSRSYLEFKEADLKTDKKKPIISGQGFALDDMGSLSELM